MCEAKNNLSILVLISGKGSNLQAIIDAIERQELAVDIRAVISNRPEAAGLLRAKVANINHHCIDSKSFTHRNHFDQELIAIIDSYQPDLVVLAGFMRILSDEFVRRYHAKLINLHPSLLPKFKGLDTHQRALDAGEQQCGASIHFVTAELDGGPVFLQTRLNISKQDTASNLALRLSPFEHKLLVKALDMISKNKIRLDNKVLYCDNKVLLQPLQI